MIGYYLNTGTEEELRKTQDLVRSAGGDVPDGERLLFVPTTSSMSHTQPADGRLSTYCPCPDEHFDAAVVSPANRLFATNLGHAFLERVARAVKKDGWVYVPCWRRSEGKKLGTWTLPWLRRVLGRRHRRSLRSGFAAFRRTDVAPAPPSVLGWYFDDFGALALDYLRQRPKGLTPELAEATKAFFIPETAGQSIQEAPPDAEAPISLAAELDSFFGSMNYLIGGANYKTAVLAAIIDTCIGYRDGLRLLDMGAGPGFVGAELLLTSPRFEKAVACDIGTHNIVLAQRLFSYYESLLAGRFYMEITTAQDYQYREQFDVISYIGSLLYVPREHLRDVLQRAWAALRPGGLLVIHENIKAPSFKNDYDVMFTVDELEGRLEPFGRLQYFSSFGAMTLAPHEVGVKTVFRVVQKT